MESVAWGVIEDNNEFQKIVVNIHRVNKAWHCFETSNRYLGIDNKYLQTYYLRKKNYLQSKLQQEYGDMIAVSMLDNDDNPSLDIKEKYHFSSNDILYTNACHAIIKRVTQDD